MPGSNETSTLFDLQKRARHEIEQAGIETAALDARVLLCHVCQISEAELIAYSERAIDIKLQGEFFDLVAKRVRRIPLAHLVGTREFWGLEFFVNSETLVPRPETEFAVEQAINIAKQKSLQNKNVRVLDLGTGTGCLLISILSDVQCASGIGVDINPQAVELAQRNALSLGVENRAEFFCMNWGENLKETFDIIVSNPPYIETGDLEGLMPEVVEYEPARALDGGKDGLDEYRNVIPRAYSLLNEQGVLILEIGDGQAGDVIHLLEQNGMRPQDAGNPVIFDLASRERIIVSVKIC